MGYTHYFKLNSDSIKKEALSDIKKLLKEYDFITFESDTTMPPEITSKEVRFNGYGDAGYETFSITPGDKDFCKTNRNEYDIVVCETLLLMKYHYGEDFELNSDGFWVTEEDYEKFVMDGEWNTALYNIKKKFNYDFYLRRTTEVSMSRVYYRVEIE